MTEICELKAVLDYEPLTGIFRWKRRVSNRAKAGDIAGTIGHKGYRAIGVSKKYYRASRLAWAFTHGYWPVQVDHINLIKDDNRLANLRETTRQGNSANRKVKTNKKSCELKGVTFRNERYGKNKWRARIRVNDKLIHLGDYATAEAAHEAYWQAAQTHFGEFARR